MSIVHRENYTLMNQLRSSHGAVHLYTALWLLIKFLHAYTALWLLIKFLHAYTALWLLIKFLHVCVSMHRKERREMGLGGWPFRTTLESNCSHL